MRHALALAAALLLATPHAIAAPQYAQAAGSTLGFASSYDGERFDGRFARFRADIAFDPATATGRIDVAIDLASANTENEERDEVLLGEEFFNASAVPQARYVATSFRKLADGRFVAEGALSLRGVSRAVPLTFRWTPGAAPVLEGTASVPRLAFKVGTGDWADLELMPDAVTVTTRVVLQPKR
jgi:polyisoprenoid-binding protein YceI